VGTWFDGGAWLKEEESKPRGGWTADRKGEQREEGGDVVWVLGRGGGVGLWFGLVVCRRKGGGRERSRSDKVVGQGEERC